MFYGKDSASYFCGGWHGSQCFARRRKPLPVFGQHFGLQCPPTSMGTNEFMRQCFGECYDRSEIVDEYLSAWKGRDMVSFFLECSKQWNVLNYCFPIWIYGKSAFATINGCRLGAQATPLRNDLLIAARAGPKLRTRKIGNIGEQQYQQRVSREPSFAGQAKHTRLVWKHQRRFKPC